MPEQGNRALFTSEGSLAGAVEQLLREIESTVDVAMYRITHPRLVRALAQAVKRGLRVRLLVDRNKYEEAAVTRQLLAESRIPFRAIYGQKGKGSKLHHKFAVLDRHIVLTGSYNWTLESDEQNYDHLMIIRDPGLVLAYQQEFDRLWPSGAEDSAV